MYLKKSPGGSYFPYFYKGGEVFRFEFGNFNSNEDRAIRMIRAEESFFDEQHQTIGVWVDFYQTKLTKRVMNEFIEMLVHIRNRIPKLGLVGCSFITRWKITRQIRKTGCLSTLPVKYFENPDDAKGWLVSESL
jgi:hypothetical protein